MISVLALRFQLVCSPDDLSGQGLSRFWSTVFPAAPGGAGYASGGHATPWGGPFSERFRRYRSADTCAPASSAKFAPRCTCTILLATGAPRSSAACRQTVAASDGSPPAAASSNAHGLSSARRFSPTAAEGWSATNSRRCDRVLSRFPLVMGVCGAAPR